MAAEVADDFVLEMIAAASQSRRDADASFKKLIAQARAGGIPVARIASAAGVSVPRVHAILVDAPAATQGNGAHGPKRDEVLVVAAGKAAYQDYHRYSAYICQAGRGFRPVERIGFYRSNAIMPEFPRIAHRRDDVEFSREEAARLGASGDEHDAGVARVVSAVLDDRARPEGHRFQVFLLAPARARETLVLPHVIAHHGVGRGSAWTMGTRYVSEAALRRNPQTTAELTRVDDVGDAAP